MCFIQDKRFNPAFDKKSGYHTKTILCVPMKTQAGVVVGVLQLINKLNDVFNDEDSELLE
jgi:adenylate cyclase